MEGIFVPANSTASCFPVDTVDLRLRLAGSTALKALLNKGNCSDCAGVLGALGDVGLDELSGEGAGLGI